MHYNGVMYHLTIVNFNNINKILVIEFAVISIYDAFIETFKII